MIAQNSFFFLIVFFIELVILSFLSTTINKLLFLLLSRVSQNQHITVYTVALIFLPGTFIHEMSHYLMALFLFVPAGHMQLLPKLYDKQIKLGSVQIAKCDILRRILIGVAPFLFGTALLLGLTYEILPYFSYLSAWAAVSIIYSIFEIGNTMFSSKKDLEGTVEFLLAITVVLVIAYLFGFRPPYINWNIIPLPVVKQLCLFSAIPVGIDLSAIAVLKVGNKLVGN